jgi:hypothetical protein
MSINPWFEIDPATLVTKERSLQSFLSQFSWDGMYDWLQVNYISDFPVSFSF